MSDVPGDYDGVLPSIVKFEWLVSAVLLTVGAAWGAYYRMGGFDTPMQKAAVVGAALVGLGVAMWLRKLLLIALYAGVLVGVLYLIGHYIHL